MKLIIWCLLQDILTWVCIFTFYNIYITPPNSSVKLTAVSMVADITHKGYNNFGATLWIYVSCAVNHSTNWVLPHNALLNFAEEVPPPSPPALADVTSSAQKTCRLPVGQTRRNHNPEM